MQILALDTSSKFLCLGIYQDGKIFEYHLAVGRELSRLLHITIQRVLKALEIEPAEIDYFACGLGPGSFTGIRTAVVTVKGLSWALKKPFVGISTLDILAKNAGDTDKPVIPAVDAKRGLIYCSLYQHKKSGLKRLKPYLLLSQKEFFRLAPEESLIFGDALGLYKDEIVRQVKGVTLLDKEYWYPKARHLIFLALERIKEKRFSSPLTIKPIYLYPKECQIKNNI